MQRASSAVACTAAAAACYLLLSDPSSNWLDWLMACGLGILTLYGARSVFQSTTEELVPTWRAADLWDAALPFVFPLYLLWRSQDRGSRIAWLGWGLLATALVIQVQSGDESDPMVKCPETKPALRSTSNRHERIAADADVCCRSRGAVTQVLGSVGTGHHPGSKRPVGR